MLLTAVFVRHFYLQLTKLSTWQVISLYFLIKYGFLWLKIYTSGPVAISINSEKCNANIQVIIGLHYKNRFTCIKAQKHNKHKWLVISDPPPQRNSLLWLVSSHTPEPALLNMSLFRFWRVFSFQVSLTSTVKIGRSYAHVWHGDVVWCQQVKET